MFLKSQKNDFMLKIKELSGYGGLIHLYKDYLETKDENLVNKIQAKHSALLKVIKYYEKFEGTSSEEKELLKQIRDTFDLIMLNTYDISQALEVDDKNTINAIHSLNEPSTHYGIPLIPIDAMAGFGTGGVQVMDYDTQKYVVPEFTELNVDFMIRVKGSSMYPKYNSGDLVACKKLVLSDIFFQWNKVYVLDTDQGALIKRIKKGSEDNLLIVSDNPAYEPYELHLSKIHAIAIVLGVIRLE